MSRTVMGLYWKNCPHEGVGEYAGGQDVFTGLAFSRSLRGARAISLCVDHKSSELLGTSADALELYQDEWGLAFKIELDDSELSDRVIEDLKTGKYGGLSVLTKTLDSEVKTVGEFGKLRLIHDCELYEISIVPSGFGAMKQAFACLVENPGSLESECKSGTLRERFHRQREPYLAPLNRRAELLKSYGIVEQFTPPAVMLKLTGSL